MLGHYVAETKGFHRAFLKFHCPRLYHLRRKVWVPSVRFLPLGGPSLNAARMMAHAEVLGSSFRLTGPCKVFAINFWCAFSETPVVRSAARPHQPRSVALAAPAALQLPPATNVAPVTYSAVNV